MRRLGLGLSQRGPAAGIYRERGGDDFDGPPDYAPTDFLWLAEPGYVYSDTAGTTLLTSAGNALSWRAVNGTLAVFNAAVAWNGVNTLTFTGSQHAAASIGARGQPESGVVVARMTTLGSNPRLLSSNSAVSQGDVLITNTTQIRIFAGSSIILNTPTLNTDMVVSFLFQNTTSVLRVNGVAEAGGAGATMGTGLRIGAAPAGNNFQGTISAVYLKPNVAFDATQRANNEAWFASRFGITL